MPNKPVPRPLLARGVLLAFKLAIQRDNPAYRADLTQAVADADLVHLPINSTSKRFDRSAFVYVPEADSYFCPAGKELKREGTLEKVVSGGIETLRKNYRCRECAGCPLSSLCRVKEDSKTGRKVSHDEYREVRQRQVDRMNDPAAKTGYQKRQHYGETPFAFIKENLGLRRFLLRGIAGVRQEWRWACLTHNLKKIMGSIAKLRAVFATEPEVAVQ